MPTTPLFRHARRIILGISVAAVLYGCGSATSEPVTTARQAAAPTATAPPQPTPRPRPTALPTRRPEPVQLSGHGQEVTRAISLPAPISIVVLEHRGTRNFIVKAHIGSREELLANEIGGYHGARPLTAQTPVTFEVSADGAWSIEVKPLTGGGRSAVSGRGDDVTALFSAPSAGAWEVQHTGERNFIVKLHCAGGSELIQNTIGAVGGSVFVRFPKGPCFWEIQADGHWSLQPRG